MPSTTLKTNDLNERQPDALVTDHSQERRIRNIIDRKTVCGEAHHWVDWEPTRMPKSELAGVRELDRFVARP